MKRSSLFGHVIELHELVRNGTRPADVVAGEFFRARRYLGAKERRFISEMVFGLLRHFRLVGFYAAEGLRRARGAGIPPAVSTVALIGAYASKLTGEDASALLPDLAGLWRVYISDIDCAAFLEALSTVSLPSAQGTSGTASLAVRYSFPDLIVNEWIERYGESETESLCASLNSPAPTTVRVNTLAVTVEQCKAALGSEGIETLPTGLSPFGLRLSKRINAHALQSYKEGFFEMQDEGSQLVSLLTEVAPGETAIDACAGGGGKTLHLAALMQNKGVLLAIDVERSRLDSIRPRLARAGVTITQLYLVPQDTDRIRAWSGHVDCVLIDAPCSGVGTFRRNPGAKISFSANDVDRVVRTQLSLLDEYAPFVKAGGRLVYSTCTLLKRENEEQVRAFLARHPDFSLCYATEILSHFGISLHSDGPFLTLLPHKTHTDGFFAAVMNRSA